MTEKRFVKKIASGDTLKQQIVVLQEITPQENGEYTCVFSDKTGVIAGRIKKDVFREEIMTFVEYPVMVSGPVLSKNGTEPEICVKSISVAPEGSYCKADLFKTISKDRLDEYWNGCLQIIENIANPHYKALVNAFFADPAFKERCYSMPATLTKHGTLRGGMLEAIFNVSKMAMDLGCDYVRCGNKVYTSNVDWSLLLAAALLHNVGNIKYYTSDEPVRKSYPGIQCGFMTLQHEIIALTAVQQKLDITADEIADLHNLWSQCDPLETERKSSRVKSVCIEAHILRGVYQTYSLMNNFDRVRSEHETDQTDTGVVYSPELRCYIHQKKVTKPTSTQKKEA